MNILFFITPKSEIAYIYEDDSIRQALEKMEYHKFSAVPLLTRDGKYVGTITEGDMLWGIKNQYNLNLKEAEGISVSTLKRRMDYLPVFVKSNMEDMIDRALNQILLWKGNGRRKAPVFLHYGAEWQKRNRTNRAGVNGTCFWAEATKRDKDGMCHLCP